MFKAMLYEGGKQCYLGSFFSAEEVRALRTLPAAEHPARFFTYWALKEAYIKARGLGLAIPLGAFTFRLDGGGPIEIAFDERITHDPGGWRFDHRWATEVHSLAVAAPRATAALEIQVHDPGLPPQRDA